MWSKWSAFLEDYADEDYADDPRNVGEDYTESYVPMPMLGPVSERPGVIRAREIILPAPGRRGLAVAGYHWECNRKNLDRKLTCSV